jgi:hypothetical protein
MTASWDRKDFPWALLAREAVVDIYDYSWACSHAAVECVPPPASPDKPFPVHVYPHHETIPRVPIAADFGSAISRERGRQADVLDAIRFRPPTEGPELRMVESFLHRGLPEPKAGERLSVMVEPKIEAAFPDIVAAYWDPLVAAAWSSARCALTKSDVRLLHYLHVEGGSADKDALLKGFRGRGIKRSIERLHTAAVIDTVGEEIRLRPIEEIFALRRLICVEAKISSPGRALDQALRCTWFASEVYLLIPAVPTDESMLRIARLHGIGMVTPGSFIEDAVVPATCARLPRSYASWMFNEWVWRLTDDPVSGRERAART